MLNRLLISFMTLGFISFFSCGSGGSPKKPTVAGSPYDSADGLYSNGIADTPCNEMQCPPINLAVSTSTGGSSLTAYVNQSASWSIQATASQSTSRRLMIVAEGGPSQCQWSNSGAQDTSCQFQPSSAESSTTPIQVKMLDVSFCEFTARKLGQQINCQDIDSVLSSGRDLGAKTSQVSWTIVENQGNNFDPNQFSLPEVKDRSKELCFMQAIGPVLGGFLGNNIAGGVAGGVSGCMQGYMAGQSAADQQRMWQQQLQYQQQMGSQNPYSQYSGQQQPYYGLTGDDDE